VGAGSGVGVMVGGIEDCLRVNGSWQEDRRRIKEIIGRIFFRDHPFDGAPADYSFLSKIIEKTTSKRD
jgi:hypothetical protein